MIDIDTRKGWTALCIIQCACMIDLAAIPLWVGTLMESYGFDARQAGALASLYIGSAVVGGLATAPLFSRMRSGRHIATIGLALAALCFFGLTRVTGFAEMAVLHALAGLSVGPALAVTEGTIGRSGRPHRLFALTAVCLSLTAAGFLAIMPGFLRDLGGVLFFQVICAILVAGSVMALLFFPACASAPELQESTDRKALKVPTSAWAGVAGLFFMSLVYSMTMSFVERVGDFREYGTTFVTAVLSAMAFIKLFPAAIAGLLEHELEPRSVLLKMPAVQAACCAAIFAVPEPAVYGVAACVFIGTLIFSHVFAFGLISRIDLSGKSVAASPSIMLAGSAIGPILGGTIITAFGYSFLALVGAVVGIMAIAAFSRIERAADAGASPHVGQRDEDAPAH
jgi:predicted MFS family arabinose efflux permease